MKIEDLDNCAGCTACFSKCPKSAIQMIKREDGFLYPNIDYSRCIRCNLCEKTCPILNKKEEKKNFLVRKVYAMKTEKSEIRKCSSSGGIFSALAEYILEAGGVVFGAAYEDNFSVSHICIHDKKELPKLIGSKYVQSELHEVFKQTKIALDNEQLVLFSGVPCQIIGLKAFLGENYDNLVCVDVVCHGVPSFNLLDSYIKYKENSRKQNVIAFNFRDKSKGWRNYSISITYENGDIEYIPHTDDLFMKLFLSDVALRKSCYYKNCKGNNRESDITIGDFWGIKNIAPNLDDDMGTSLVIVNSQKGLDLINSLKSCSKQEVSYNESISYNPSITISAKLRKHKEEFYRDLINLDYSVMVDRYTRSSFIEKLRIKIKRIARKFYYLVKR